MLRSKVGGGDEEAISNSGHLEVIGCATQTEAAAIISYSR